MKKVFERIQKETRQMYEDVRPTPDIRKIIDPIMGRKPGDWDEVPSTDNEEVKAFARTLDLFQPADVGYTSDSGHLDTIEKPVPQWFVFMRETKDGTKYYLVNTEGYDYMRYVVELEDFELSESKVEETKGDTIGRLKEAFEHVNKGYMIIDKLGADLEEGNIKEVVQAIAGKLDDILNAGYMSDSIAGAIAMLSENKLEEKTFKYKGQKVRVYKDGDTWTWELPGTPGSYGPGQGPSMNDSEEEAIQDVKDYIDQFDAEEE